MVIRDGRKSNRILLMQISSFDVEPSTTRLSTAANITSLAIRVRVNKVSVPSGVHVI